MGERRRGRHRARTRGSKPSSTSPNTCGSARATCSPPRSCGGPTRRSSRTRTSGGTRASTARCSSTARRARSSPTCTRPRRSPPTSTTGTLDLRVDVDFDEAAAGRRLDRRRARARTERGDAVTAAEFRGARAADAARRTASAATPCACTPRSPRRAVVGRDARPATGCRSRCSTPTATCTTPRRARIGFRRIEIRGREFLRQRRAGAVPRRQPARLRSRHRSGRDRRADARPTSC